MKRRDFLKASGALLVAFALPKAAQAGPESADAGEFNIGAPQGESPQDLNAYIRIDQSGTITLQMPATEVGQGVSTALPMLLAEELDALWENVHVESAPSAKAYRRSLGGMPPFIKAQGTGGSESVMMYWQPLREAGAKARAMLVMAAAQKWGVSTKDCTTAGGQVHHGGNSLSYGELAEAAAKLSPPKAPALKDPKDFKLLGTSPSRLDLRSKTDGSAVFAIDMHVPEMLYGTVVANPHRYHGIMRYDDAKARALPGIVEILQHEDAILVIAQSQWQAFKAAKALEITWEKPAAPLDDATIWRHQEAALKTGGMTVVKKGKKPKTWDVERAYWVPYLEHTPLEPLVATADVRTDRVDLWSGTQNQQGATQLCAKLTGVKEEHIHIHVTYAGGAFGRRYMSDFLTYAVVASKAMGKPVKVVWQREECFKRGWYRPAVMGQLRANLRKDGTIEDFSASVTGQNHMEFTVGRKMGRMLSLIRENFCEGISHLPFPLKSHHVEWAWLKDWSIGTGIFRSVGYGVNGFFIESFVDEIAHEVGEDPIQYRLRLLKDAPRELAVLKAAIALAKDVPADHHRGVAVMKSFGSYLAQIVDITLDKKGWPRAQAVYAAVDCGKTVHPDTIKAQIMGGICMGTSMTLRERLHFKAGQAVERNLNTYALGRMLDMPKNVEVEILDSDASPGGIGEVGVTTAAAALVNAYYQATGKRIRQLPLSEQLPA